MREGLTEWQRKARQSVTDSAYVLAHVRERYPEAVRASTGLERVFPYTLHYGDQILLARQLIDLPEAEWYAAVKAYQPRYS